MDHNSSAESIGRRISSVRQNLGYTLTDFASLVGVSRSYISYIESGKRNAPPELLQRIATACHVDYYWLTGVLDSKEIDSATLSSSEDINQLLNPQVIRMIMMVSVNYGGMTIEELSSRFGFSQETLKSFLCNSQIELPFDDSILPILRALYSKSNWDNELNDSHTASSFFEREQIKERRLIAQKLLSSYFVESGYSLSINQVVPDGFSTWTNINDGSEIVVAFPEGVHDSTEFYDAFPTIRDKIRQYTKEKADIKRELMICAPDAIVREQGRFLGFNEESQTALVSQNLIGWSYNTTDFSKLLRNTPMRNRR